MLSFTIFGIPVRVSPIFWIVPLIVSGALHMDPGPAMLQRILIYAVVIFFSILAHELGHALTGLKYGGGQAAIELNGMGGLAFNRGGRFDLKGRRKMIAMGPGAGFILLGVALIAVFLIFGIETGNFLAKKMLFNNYLDWHLVPKGGLLLFLHATIWINFWWGIFNLLPIMPLDGGQLYESFSKSPKKVFRIGLITAVIVALWGLTTGSLFIVILMGFLAMNNYRAMQEARY